MASPQRGRGAYALRSFALVYHQAGVAGEVVLIAREVEEVAQDLAEESLQVLTVGDAPDSPVHPAEVTSHTF